MMMMMMMMMIPLFFVENINVCLIYFQCYTFSINHRASHIVKGRNETNILSVLHIYNKRQNLSFLFLCVCDFVKDLTTHSTHFY